MTQKNWLKWKRCSSGKGRVLLENCNYWRGIYPIQSCICSACASPSHHCVCVHVCILSSINFKIRIIPTFVFVPRAKSPLALWNGVGGESHLRFGTGSRPQCIPFCFWNCDTHHPREKFFFLYGIESLLFFIPVPWDKEKKTDKKVEGLKFDLAFYSRWDELCRRDFTVSCFWPK